MKREKFTIVHSPAILLNRESVDTDQIIPARFLKSTNREGFGDNLFYDLRFTPSGEKEPNFPLNSFKGESEILVAGYNFGCGSSREHAAWALMQYGFRAVVSSFFADIFKNNALNNGLLPVQVSKEFLASIFDYQKTDNEPINLTIDIMKKEITFNNTRQSENFGLSTYNQECFINGYDTIDYLLSSEDEIIRYEQFRSAAY